MTHLSVPEKFLRVKFVIGKADTSGGVCVDQGDIISSDRLHHHDQTIQTGGVKTLDKTTTSSTVNTGTLNLTTGKLLYTLFASHSKCNFIIFKFPSINNVNRDHYFENINKRLLASIWTSI